MRGVHLVPTVLGWYRMEARTSDGAVVAQAEVPTGNDIDSYDIHERLWSLLEVIEPRGPALVRTKADDTRLAASPSS